MVNMTTEYFRKKSGCNSVNIACTDLKMCYMVAEMLKHLIAL